MVPQKKNYHVVYFRPRDAGASPVRREYEKEVQQPKERAKIEAVLENLELYGWQTPGARFEKVEGSKENIYELKIKAFNSEHRFLLAYAPVRASDDLPVLVLLRYIKKKKWKISREDIKTAEDRFCRLSQL